MPAFYPDEDVHKSLIVEIQSRGHSLTQATANQRLPDCNVLLDASISGGILVTHNHDDYLLLHRAWMLWPSHWRLNRQPVHFGILSIPQLRKPYPPGRTPVEVVDEIEAIVRSHSTLECRFFRFSFHDGWVELT